MFASMVMVQPILFVYGTIAEVEVDECGRVCGSFMVTEYRCKVPKQPSYKILFIAFFAWIC